MESDLLKLMAARGGHFKLESGHHGDLWLEPERLFLHPHSLAEPVRQLAQQFAPYDIEGVCGPLTGGAFLAQMIAAELRVAFCHSEPYTRQDPGSLYPVGYRVPGSLARVMAGKRVAIVDDVINAGSAVRGTYSALVQAGVVVAAVGALLTLGSAAPDHFTAHGIAVVSAVWANSNLWPPSDCPLCAQHIPLEDLRA